MKLRNEKGQETNVFAIVIEKQLLEGDLEILLAVFHGLVVLDAWEIKERNLMKYKVWSPLLDPERHVIAIGQEYPEYHTVIDTDIEGEVIAVSYSDVKVKFTYPEVYKEEEE